MQTDTRGGAFAADRRRGLPRAMEFNAFGVEEITPKAVRHPWLAAFGPSGLRLETIGFALGV